MSYANRAVGLSPDRVRELTGGLVKPSAGPSDTLGRWLEEQRVKITGRVNVFQVEVTPALALAWMKFNTRNRVPSKAKIRRFATAMRAGKWHLNGESIKFGASGRLLDGQSRLQAVILANVPVTLEIRGGIADAAQECMDTGEARKHAHQLEMLGEKHPNECAAALRLLWLWEESGHASGLGKSGDRGAITNTTIRETLERHPRVRESVGRCLNLKQLFAVSAAAFFHYLFARVDQKKADLFIERLTTGANLSATSPIYLLRERLTSDRLAQAKLRKRDKFALVVKAWNAFRNGKSLERLVFGANEEFPAISGLAPNKPAAAGQGEGAS